MSEDAFRQNYEHMTDEQFALVAADRKDLVPEAVAALDFEAKRRHVGSPQPRTLAWQPDLDEQLKSLEDSPGYQRLLGKKRFMDRFWYLVALGPVVLMPLLDRYAFRNPENIRYSLAWVILITEYWLFLKGRFSAYSCPQCGQRFGSGSACYRCAFPRSRRRKL